MASGYALPTAGGSHHAYSHSYSGIHLSPDKAMSSTLPNGNGSIKKAVSNSNLYTHAETSRETSPLPSPHNEHHQHNHFPSFEQNAFAFQENARWYQNTLTHSRSPMKSRPRGESDLGRPADVRSSAYKPALESIPAASTSWFSLPEALTSLLIPLPYLLASAAYSSGSVPAIDDFPPLSAYVRPQQSAFSGASSTVDAALDRPSGVLQACALTSSTLLLVGMVAKLRAPERTLDRRKDPPASSPLDASPLLSASALQSMATKACSIGLPLYASMQLGGTRVGLVLLIAVAANLTCSDMTRAPSIREWKRVWSSKVATSVALLLGFICDEAGLTIQSSLTDVLLGYFALATSVLVLQPPFPIIAAAATSRPSSGISTTASASPPWSRHSSRSISLSMASPLTCSVDDVNRTLIAGAVIAVTTILASLLQASDTPMLVSTKLLSTLTVAAMASSILYSLPSTIRSQSRAGLALGCLLTASCSFLFSPTLWPGTICNGGLAALSFLGALYDTNGSVSTNREHHEGYDHAHNAHTYQHRHHHAEGGSSAFTKFIIARCEPGSLLFGILSEKDSRRIAYFTVLNFGFMIVQGAYGYLSGSLGLLSDTVHMFFDCLGLVVGLGAAVASKWPTSPEKPYGWGKLNTLAGFGNGIFLMLVSVEFVWEAIEGMVEGRELRHVLELLVVSTLGLLVNLVGLLAFGHAHAGHDHGHSHSHSQSSSHEHGHGHGHGHMNGHAHSHECDHSHEQKPPAAQGHAHHNENMHGIFLHVAADAGGSLAVIISTALTLWRPWYLWDPLATIIIAVLIFAAAVPLVTSSGQKLLLVIPNELEYNIKNTLQELGELRGVVGYAVPRFWVDDRDEAGDSHGHDHGHGHGGQPGKQKVMGVIHVIAAQSAELNDVRKRVEDFVAGRNMDLVVHVEREAEGQCWCGGSAPKSG